MPDPLGRAFTTLFRISLPFLPTFLVIWGLSLPIRSDGQLVPLFSPYLLVRFLFLVTQLSRWHLDFTSDPDVVRLVVEGECLSYGHLFNPAFATEISMIEPLPHQRIAVYDHMMQQPRLRFL